ncbi:MAG TPA: phytanoyl-CoA dioxygenase family protein, partial [Kiloniellales bacterium]|nr:phytanoyl-CoA dioxygenase family protein [Kiloniellales bacterium]
MLSDEAVASYRRDGFYFPVPVLSESEALGYRRRLEAAEAANGGPLKGNQRHKVHILHRWAYELVTHPRILDAVEDILGPNLICWTTNFFIKEAHDPAFVSFHQDATYWGLDPPDVMTAWVALSDCPMRSGPMVFAPGTHKTQLAHRDTFHKDNLLTRGQEIAAEVDPKDAVAAILKPGEISLHHVMVVHGSRPNESDDRRIGLAIRYIPTHVRQVKLRDAAILVRGRDDFGYFDRERVPETDGGPAERAAHKAAM